MADEVSTGELARRLGRMEDLLLRLVSVDVYGRDQREIERRFGEIERDLLDEREARKTDIKALHERLDKADTNRRQTVFSGLMPWALVLFGTAINVWIALRGGK